MKILSTLILIVIFSSTQLLAQYTELQRVWDLREITFETGPNILINTIEPEIHPYIEIHSDLSFTAHGACTPFSGQMIYTQGEEYLHVSFQNINFPVNDCGSENTNQVEGILRYYFNENSNWISATGIDPNTGITLFGIGQLMIDFLMFESRLEAQLFDTWYLHEVQIEPGNKIIVNEFQPQITPTLTIESDFNYHGNLSCNSFEGGFNLEQDDVFFTSFSATLMNCETQEMDNFEYLYTQLFEGQEHFPVHLNYHSETGEIELQFGEENAGYYLFKKSSPHMGISSEEARKIKIYPNPTSDFLQIENAPPNSEYQIYSMDGKLIQKGKIEGNSSVKVSNLISGNYILKLENQSIKFIKK
jgi:heat shock protein HslJ